MDTFKTENYYRTLSEDCLCSCDYCKNYYKEIKETYPILAEYFLGMGIDIKKPFKAISLEPHAGTIEYIAVQYIVMGDPSGFMSADVSGVHIGIAKSHPWTGVDKEHFVIEVSPITLKWSI